MSDQNDRITANQLAGMLKKSLSTISKWRRKGYGPPFHRMGARDIYYLRSEVEAWLASCDGTNLLPSREGDPDEEG